VRDRFRHVGPGESVQKEGYHEQGAWNPVSDVDREAETTIVEYIGERYPDHSFLGEENIAGQITRADHLWVIDPIDGTSNFLHGMPHFAVSIGYAYRGEIEVAACYDPLRNEMFTARRGAGAFLNGEEISVSSPSSIDSALVCTGFYYDRGAVMERTLEAIRLLFRRGIHGIRRTGSAVLDICWHAAGRYDGYFEFQLNPWDFLPAALIATEAGSTVTTTEGTPLTIAGTSALCTGGSIHDEFLTVLAEA
jgi:myo-inositol-1(or 4)-monophosphatase